MKADLGFTDLAKDNSHGPRADFHHKPIRENPGNSLPILIALHFNTPRLPVSRCARSEPSSCECGRPIARGEISKLNGEEAMRIANGASESDGPFDLSLIDAPSPHHLRRRHAIKESPGRIPGLKVL